MAEHSPEFRHLFQTAEVYLAPRASGLHLLLYSEGSFACVQLPKGVLCSQAV